MAAPKRYGYDTLNRLTNMSSTCGTAVPGCAAPGTPISSYAYTLGPAGNRLSVAELSGRTVNYGYDDLYRLTSETVSLDPKGNNGQVSYTFDSVGNQVQRQSTLPGVVATGLLNYDANDRTSTDPYDQDGNLLSSGAGANVYDFENHLVAAGGVNLVYDGDGNRVQETVGTVTTSYLIADQNLTGYAQVLDELQNNTVSRTYSYGLELINETQTLSGAPATSFYGFDGHGSVRFLTDLTGSITDTYDYDAFGILISQTGTTSNNYLFAGEQFDPAVALYYNRARYYDQRSGRFWTMDTWEGSPFEPPSLHRYLYASANPVNRIDPNGQEDADVGQQVLTTAAFVTLAAITVLTLAWECVATAQNFGVGPCTSHNEDSTRQFYRGTSYYEGLELESSLVDPSRFLNAPWATNYDFGPGLYMTESLTTARYFALINGVSGKGGPAILDIQIKQSQWETFLARGALESKPISGLQGQGQAFVPVTLILEFLKTARILLRPYD